MLEVSAPMSAMPSAGASITPPNSSAINLLCWSYWNGCCWFSHLALGAVVVGAVGLHGPLVGLEVQPLAVLAIAIAAARL